MLVWRLDRLGQSVPDLLTTLQELEHLGVGFVLLTEALDLTNGNIRAVQRYSRHRDLRILNLYDDNRTDLGGDVARLVAANI